MELLHQASLDVKFLSLVPLGASLLLLPLLVALRFLRRGPARFWLAPSFLFALLPSSIGAAISAWLLRSARETTMFGGEGFAVTARVLELQMPLLAGLLASMAVRAHSGRRRAGSTPDDGHGEVRTAVSCWGCPAAARH